MSETPINTGAAANKLFSFLNSYVKPKQLHADELTGLVAADMMRPDTCLFVKSQGLQMLRTEYRTYYDDLPNNDFKVQGIVGLFYGMMNVYLLPEETEMSTLFALYKEGN